MTSNTHGTHYSVSLYSECQHLSSRHSGYDSVHSPRLCSLICSSSALNSWKQLETQSTCLTGTSKDSQFKCEITSHLDSWVPNTSNPHYGKDHMRSFSRAGAVETKLILFVSERGSLYLQPEGMSSASLGRGSSQQSDKTSWTGMRKRLVISDRSLCCVGGVIQLLKTPQTTSSNHI